MEREETIAEIQRSRDEQIRVRITEFRKRTYVDLRTYYLSDDDEYLPTKLKHIDRFLP